MSKIRGNQIKDESITGSQIENDTLTGDDIDESTLVMTLNDVLSDGASTTITITSGNIIPSADVTYDLGSATDAWNNIYANNGTINDLTVLNTLTLSGSDISFSDNNGTYPTSSGGFYWDLNNDEARIYAEQPGSDQISFYFKLSDNSNTSNDRYVFWHQDYRGISYHRYPLVMYGENFYIHSPPSVTSGIPDFANAKVTIPNGTSSSTTTTHKGRLFLSGDNTDDLYIRFQNNTENAYIFQDQSNSNSFKMESANDIAFNTNGPNERMRINSAGDVTISNALTIGGGEINTGGDLTFDANGGQIYMKDNGVTYLTFNVDGVTDSIQAVGHLKLEASADIYLNAQQGDIYFQDNGTQRLRVENTSGDFAVGNHSPVYRLDVHKNTSSFVASIENDYTSAGADLLRMKLNISNPASSSAIIYVYDSSNTSIYAVQGNGAGGSTVSTSFTAGHDTVISKSENVIPGMIIESTGEVWFKPVDTTFETALPKCRLADTNGSKKVFGVISGFPSSEEDDVEYVHNGYKMKPAFIKYAQQAGVGENEWNISTMSIGEGVIWITNIGGDISNGDLIESSEIAGYGRLQSDDIMRSKTVAKCTEDIDWDSITDVINHNGIDYKKYLASCTFHCG